jgi:hypothetical protein
MTRILGRGLCVAAAAAALAGCGGMGGMPGLGSGWTTLVDGTRGMENFARSGGDADWSAQDGAIQATKGGKDASYLVSREVYGDFEMRVEMWVGDESTNSGVFVRCQDRAKIDAETCYEFNIWGRRPDPTYGSGAIVNVAPVGQPVPLTGGRWNTLVLTARGERLTFVLNGQKTSEGTNPRLARGPFALQWGSGTVKFRKVEIRPL